MAIRTALLNGNNINRDTDFSKYIETVSEPGVIEGLAVSSSSVAIGKARVPCERSNGDEIFALVYVTSAQSISGDGDVYIEVGQTYIDNGELSPEDGTGIATIGVGTMPAKNALKLAVKSGTTITDARNMIKTVGQLKTLIDGLTDDVEDLDERVEALEEADAIDHLEESGLVGELYTLNDKLFKQYTPALADSTVDCNVGDVAANTQIHIQRIASGVESNQLKLKVKKTGSPTQNLIVEVRKGVQVTVTANAEAYWYGDQVVASGSIAYGNITTSYQELTVTLNNNFGGTKGELLDVVVYQNNSTVNASNYFCVACDSTQYSEGFSYVSVNGSTRTRSKLMPYCISDGFAQSLIVKAITSTISITSSGNFTVSEAKGGSGNAEIYQWSKNNTATYNYNEGMRAALFSVSSPGTYKFKIKIAGSNQCKFGFGPNISNIRTEIYGPGNNTETEYEITMNVNAGETIYIYPYLTGPAYSGLQLYISYTYTYSLNLVLTKDSNILGLVSDVNSLGNLGIITIYGIDSDGVYKGGIMLSKETTATTGSITLGNAVGFIKVNLNGEIVKIPYYSE